jgi:hypothetical protein
MKSSPDLDGIPAELTAGIIKLLPRVDILNLSLTCRHLRNQTEPELYREFVLSYDRKFIQAQLDPSKVGAFTARIISKPELAKHVKRVELRYWSILGEYAPTRYLSGEEVFD